MTQLRKVDVRDGSGNAIGSKNGALKVYNGDVNIELFNTLFRRDTTGGFSTTLNGAVSAGATQIVVASAAGMAVGNKLLLGTELQERLPSTITNIAGAPTIVLDFPLDKAYADGTAVVQQTANMNANGTLAAPVSFKIVPPAGHLIHLTRFLIEMTHTTAGDNGLFGNLAALTNGVVLRRYDGATASTEILTVWRSNGDIAVDMYDITYAARSGGGGAYGTNARWSIGPGLDGSIQLDGDAGDYIEALVQDNLSTLTRFNIKAQGHHGE